MLEAEHSTWKRKQAAGLVCCCLHLQQLMLVVVGLTALLTEQSRTGPHLCELLRAWSR
jgi:hypothetical protein